MGFLLETLVGLLIQLDLRPLHFLHLIDIMTPLHHTAFDRVYHLGKKPFKSNTLSLLLFGNPQEDQGGEPRGIHR